MTAFKASLAAVALACGSAVSGAYAAPLTLLTFAQSTSETLITGTASGGVTTIFGSAIPITIAYADPRSGLAPNTGGWLTYHAVSDGPATSLGQSVAQLFDGTFSITSAPGNGINILSGAFNDSLVSGQRLALSFIASGVDEAADSLNFSSDVFPSAILLDPSAFSFSLTTAANLRVVGGTIGSFRARIAGVSEASQVPEPATWLLLLGGIAALGAALRFRKTGTTQGRRVPILTALLSSRLQRGTAIFASPA